MTLGRGLLNKKITFVTGKGGVGKTTTAAALGLLAAQRGRRVLVCELGSDGHLERLFKRKIGHVPVTLSERLDAANFSVGEGLVGTLTSVLPIERVVRAVVQNRVLQMFMETAPSVREAVLLDALGQQVNRYDNVFVDLPASGHALTLLTVPQMIQRLVRRGPVAKKAETLQQEIFDPARSQIVLVALPEALPVQETIELSKKLASETTLPQAAIVLNSSTPHPIDESERALLERLRNEAAPGSELARHAARLLRGSNRDETALRKLEAETHLPVIRLPLVDDPEDILVAAQAALASFA